MPFSSGADVQILDTLAPEIRTTSGTIALTNLQAQIDYERADALREQLVLEAPAEGTAHVARDLDRAEHLRVEPLMLVSSRASTQSVGLAVSNSTQALIYRFI